KNCGIGWQLPKGTSRAWWRSSAPSSGSCQKSNGYT
ncbi:hypothetical protein L520_1831, partial [Bordetella bronchiseptica MBORD681]